jgi:hypothetical protein
LFFLLLYPLVALVGALNVARKETGVKNMYDSLAEAFKEHLLGRRESVYVCVCVCVYACIRGALALA